MSDLLDVPTKQPILNDYYVTFGFAHTDKYGNRLKNCFIHFRERDSAAVADKMYAVFGKKWSIIYDKDRWVRNGKTQQEVYNLTEIKYDDYLSDVSGQS